MVELRRGCRAPKRKQFTSNHQVESSFRNVKYSLNSILKFLQFSFLDLVNKYICQVGNWNKQWFTFLLHSWQHRKPDNITETVLLSLLIILKTNKTLFWWVFYNVILLLKWNIIWQLGRVRITWILLKKNQSPLSQRNKISFY